MCLLDLFPSPASFFLFSPVSSCQKQTHFRSNSPFLFFFLFGVDGLGFQC